MASINLYNDLDKPNRFHIVMIYFENGEIVKLHRKYNKSRAIEAGMLTAFKKFASTHNISEVDITIDDDMKAVWNNASLDAPTPECALAPL